MNEKFQSLIARRNQYLENWKVTAEERDRYLMDLLYGVETFILQYGDLSDFPFRELVANILDVVTYVHFIINSEIVSISFQNHNKYNELLNQLSAPKYSERWVEVIASDYILSRLYTGNDPVIINLASLYR